MSFQQLPPPQGMPYPGPPPTLPKPPRRRTDDPPAVALGNASLLGLGYFLARRPFFGFLGLAGTTVLLVLMYQRKDAAYQFALLGWGLLQVVHGYFLAARKSDRKSSIPKRIVAAVVTLAVVGTAIFLKRGAAAVEDEVTAAREAGRCVEVVQAQGRVWFGDRLVAGRAMERGDRDAEICGTLSNAEGLLYTATQENDTMALREAYEILDDVAGDPRHQQTAGAAMDRFVKDLQAMKPCPKTDLTAWLGARKLTHNVLDRGNAVVARIEPNALLACADSYASQDEWQKALTTYQRLVSSYPKAKQSARARAGITRAVLALELENVRDLITSGDYCSRPARYSGAKPFGRGYNPAIFLGEGTDHIDQLPAGWKLSDPYRAKIVVCTGEEGLGAATRTCPYVPENSPYGPVTQVTFRKVTVPVRVYELRTARLVLSTTLSISGESCPYYLSNWYSGDRTRAVTPSNAQVQAAFRPLLFR
ncbi:hypothetical protein [Kribbella sp. NPDC048915]|uniref:tol-pal system YbgF family protein n=1 Tax=Kribbella sp. NPDC048915 TaxID=3155148 RepID=UPI0033CEA304